MHASAAIFAPIRIFDIGHHLDSALGLDTSSEMAYRFTPEYGPAGFKCCDCGAVRMFPHSLPGSTYVCTTGYATVQGNQLCCYACADARQRRDLLDQSKPFGAYLSKLPGGQRVVTTWTGGRLGDVHALTFSRSGWHGAEIARFHVRDVHGQWWQGRGAGDGMCCTLRKMKQPAYAARWGV